MHIRFSLACRHRGSSLVSRPNDQLLIFGLNIHVQTTNQLIGKYRHHNQQPRAIKQTKGNLKIHQTDSRHHSIVYYGANFSSVPQVELVFQTLTQLVLTSSDSPVYIPGDFQAWFRLPADILGDLNHGIAHPPIKPLALSRSVISSTEGRPRPQ